MTRPGPTPGFGRNGYPLEHPSNAPVELFVVVTIADNGVVHAWGEGPVVGGQATPFVSRARARTVAAEFRRDGAQARTCKLLGTQPVTAYDGHTDRHQESTP